MAVALLVPAVARLLAQVFLERASELAALAQEQPAVARLLTQAAVGIQRVWPHALGAWALP